MRRLIIIATMLAGAPLGAVAAEPLLASRAQDVFKEFDGTDRPGCSAGVMQDGRLTLAFARGMADLDARVPLSADTVFNIASVSKQFTAFGVLLLEQRGALTRDDPITKHVPEIGAYASKVTLRHLLHHTGGLRDYAALLALQGYPLTVKTTGEQALQMLSRQRGANTNPGTEYDYSNTGYFLLGIVIERVSGKSLRQFMHDEVFQPLGMKDTQVVDHYPAGIAKLARGYSPGDSTQRGYAIDESLWEQIGDGQVHTTVGDLARWEHNLLTGKVGGLPLIAKLLEPGRLSSGKQLNYAAGVAIGEYRGLPFARHGGDWAGYRAHFARFPAQRFAVAVLCNRSDVDASRYAGALADIYLEDQIARANAARGQGEGQEHSLDGTPRGWAPKTLVAYAGTYSSPEALVTYELKARGGALVLDTGKAILPLRPAARNEFEGTGLAWEGEQFTLRFSPQSPGFLLSMDGLRDLRFERLQ